MKRFAVALTVAVTLPALAAPFALRSEAPLSAPEFGVSASISRGDARIATNGDEYLTVWTDTRHGGEPSVYAARLRAEGTLVDPVGLRVETGAYAGPVVWTGTTYLIAYENSRTSRSYVRTMTPDGVFGEPVFVGREARWGSMATNGTNVLLVLPKEAKLLDLEGHELRDVALASFGNDYFHTRIAATDSSYLVVAAFPRVVVQAVSSDGVASAAQTLAEPAQFTRIDVASDGERFLVVWPDKRIYAQLVTPDGVPTGPVQKLALTPSANYPGVAWRDGEYVVVFMETGEFQQYAVRVAADGSAIGDPKPIGKSFVPEVDLAAHGRAGIVFFAGRRAGVFDDGSLAGEDVFRRTVDVAVTARPQTNVHLDRLGDGFVAAWVEDHRIFLSNGTGTTPVAVVGSNTSLIDVLVDRSNIVWVIWGTWKSFAILRFHENLEAVDPGPITIQTPGPVAYTAAAAGEGVIALAYDVWNEDTQDANTRDVAALLLWETGTGIARRDVLLTTQPFADYNPTVTFDGSSFTYGWLHAQGEIENTYEPVVPAIEIVAARVSTSGEVLDATPVRVADDVGVWTQIESARGDQGVAFAWQDDGEATRVALFDGTTVDLGGPEMSLGELAPHDGGFLLVRGVSRRTPLLTEVEYIALEPDLSISARGMLPPYEADAFWKAFDIDVIGGSRPVFVYVKSANSVYGNVPRIFVREAGPPPSRRRAVR